MEIRLITNADLALANIPPGSVGDEALDYFALSFDGYAFWGKNAAV